MRISSAGLKSPTVTLKSARLQHDQRKIVSRRLCPSKLGDRSVNRLYQFVSALLRVHTRNLCQPRRRVLFSCLILSFDRPPQCTEPERLRGADRSCHSRSPNWEAHQQRPLAADLDQPAEYVHPYEVRQYRAEERLPERHVLHERTEHERTAAREGRYRVEEHRDHRSR